MHVLITRPREDAVPLAEALRQAGVSSTVEPLLDIVQRQAALPDLASIQGILITSANGIRAFAAQSPTRNLTVWAVGDASARAARALGFADVRSASGDVDALAMLVCAEADPAAGPLLHVAGTRVAGDLAGQLELSGFVCQRYVLYEACTTEFFSDDVLALFASQKLDGVLLYSPRTAALFLALIANAAQQEALGSVTAFCLSSAVAAKIETLPWKQVVVADTPDEAALIAEVLAEAQKV